MNNKNQNTGISILRLVLAYLVVLCHFCTLQPDSFLDYFRRFAVPCFTFLSFYLLANKLNNNVSFKLFRNRIWRLFLPMSAWAVIYYVYYQLIGRDFPIRDLMWQIFTGHSYNGSMWFISNQIIIVAIIFLVFMLKNETMRNVMLIILFFVSIATQYSGIELMCLPYLNYELSTVVTRVPEILPFAIMGYYFKRFEDRIDNKYRIYLSTVLIFIPYILCTLPLVDPEGLMYQGYKVLLGSLAFSVAFIIVPIRNIKFIDHLSKYALGIYCVHMMVGELIILKLGDYGFQYPLTPIGSLGIYVVSLMVSVAIGQVPFIKKVII